jgi:hypothetical protein
VEWLAENADWLFSGILVVVAGTILSAIVASYRDKIRVRVLMHQAYWDRSTVPYLFIKVTNFSRSRDVEVTHVWLATEPKTHVVRNERPLPTRLRPLETWETWVERHSVPAEDRERPYKLGRVRLSGGETFRSRENESVPEFGHVAGKWPENR